MIDGDWKPNTSDMNAPFRHVLSQVTTCNYKLPNLKAVFVSFKNRKTHFPLKNPIHNHVLGKKVVSIKKILYSKIQLKWKVLFYFLKTLNNHLKSMSVG